MRIARIICAALLCLTLAGCALSEEKDGVRIVCTSFPCYDIARAVAGEEADVRMLIKPGGEVHSYEPTPTDIMEIAGCDLFVYIGGESDVWVETMLESLGGDAPKTLRLFDCVEALEEETTDEMTFHESTEEEEEPEYDEHIWTSPKNMAAMVNAMAEALPELPNARENADLYIGEILRIDKEIAEIVKGAKRSTVVFADRFPLLYFVREFGLDYAAAFPSCTSESEPSAHTVAALIDRVKTEKIPVVFKLEMSSGRVAETIAEATGACVRTFESAQNITADDFAKGETYVTLMQKNMEALREALN